MLRLKATKIELGPKDLVWHIDRCRQRKAQYEQETHVNVLTKATSKINEPHTFTSVIPDRLRSPVTAAMPSTSASDNALFSSEPVPRNSRAFWNNIVAVAGTSSNSTGPLPHERYAEEDVVRTATSHHRGDSFDSSDGIEESSDAWPVRQSGEEAPIVQDVVEAATQLMQPGSQVSSPSLQSAEQGKSSADSDQSVINVEEDLSNASTKRRSFFRFLNPTHDGSTDAEMEDMQRSFSSQLDFDGSRDSVHEHTEHEHHLELATAIYVATAPRPVLRHVRPLAGQDNLSRLSDDEAELAELVEELHEVIDGAALPRALLAGPVEHLRSHSGTLPRSPLHISHAMVSSSPEIRSRTPSFSAHSAGSRLPLPLRSQRRYIPRSGASDDSLLSERTPAETPNVQLPSVGSSFGSSSTSPRHTNSSNVSIYGSSPMSQIHTTAPQSEPRRHPDPVHSSPNPHSPPPLPPPFSTTRRLVSFNLSLPSSSPRNPFTSPIRPSPASSSQITLSPLSLQASSPANPLSPPRNPFILPHPPSSRSPSASPPPQRLSLTPPLPSTPHRRIRIYNDALSPSTQPQTPVGLPRNGVAHMPWSPLPPPYTAPAALRARPADRTWEQTPTRNVRRRVEAEPEDQENYSFGRELLRLVAAAQEEREAEDREWDGGVLGRMTE